MLLWRVFSYVRAFVSLGRYASDVIYVPAWESWNDIGEVRCRGWGMCKDSETDADVCGQRFFMPMVSIRMIGSKLAAR